MPTPLPPGTYGAGSYGRGPYGRSTTTTSTGGGDTTPPPIVGPPPAAHADATGQLVPPGFTVYAVDTVNGVNYGPIDCIIKSWSRVLNGSETATIELNAGEDSLNAGTRDYYRQITTPALMSLVIDWAGTVVWAGPIWNRSRQGAAVTVTAAGIGNLFTRRKLIGGTGPYATQTFTYSGVSLGTIAQRIVRYSLARPGGSLPILFPTGEQTDGDATHVRTWYGYELATVSDLLTNLTGVEGGPDIDFRPYWLDANRSGIRWAMLTGTAAAPLLTSQNQLTFDWSSPESGVIDLQVQDDASQLVTDQWGKGSGSETATLIAHRTDSTLTGSGYPLLEGETDYTTVTEQATLDTHAAGDLAAYGRATDQWQLTVDALTDPTLGSYQLGDLPTVRVAGDFWIPDGVYSMRIVGISGDNSTQVKLAVQGLDARGLVVLNSPDQSIAARIRRLERAALTGR